VQDKAEDLLEMKRKMLELQEQVKRLEKDRGGGAPSAGPALPMIPAIPATPVAPAVDPRSVHVQGISPLAVAEVIAAHFSGYVAALITTARLIIYPCLSCAWHLGVGSRCACLLCFSYI
jgi:hypothetical protein